MALLSQYFQKSKYARLSKEEANEDRPDYQIVSHWSTFQLVIFLLLSTMFSMTIGLAVGYFAHQSNHIGPLGVSSDRLI